VYGLALKILANSQEAEDLTQEIFLTLWRKASTNPDCRFFVRYLITITRSRAIDKLRDRTRQLKLVEKVGTMSNDTAPEPTPVEHVSNAERSQRVHHALSQLPEKQRQVIELAYNQGLSQTDTLRIPKTSRKWMQIAGSIAALLVLALGIDNYRLRQNLAVISADNQKLRQDFAQAQDVKNLLQNSQTRLFTFQAVNSTGRMPRNASGSIVINPQKQKAVMVFQNLPAPPPGQVYLLWTVINDEKLPCGQVKPYAWGTASYELPFTNQMYQEFSHPKFSGLIITLESDANVPRPTGTVVMQSSQI
jgi:RNA polymerase sigma factor (sigma-70 family)